MGRNSNSRLMQKLGENALSIGKGLISPLFLVTSFVGPTKSEFETYQRLTDLSDKSDMEKFGFWSGYLVSSATLASAFVGGVYVISN